ncbi:hypothetical protein ACFO4P_17140 [Epilithonimonas pallida]|uniref:Terminase-like family protein n=1 Tax=Epilithonimonas pallida TaxID=373671 RepID=A0ABY1R4W1_9FLAO|nr:hypothetical protein [Epilithonimonas pallida]SMP94715.1 hypothetical protein SAMN05421679_106114 [Epilithonimonas pallida]
MKQKIHVKTDFDDIELRYASWLKTILDLMQPKNAFLILGRGTGKTTDFIAERSMDACYDMPHSYQALIGDTYTNILKNIAPALIEGWNRKGWREGLHYVVDEPPPSHFKLPYKAPQTYKHTISTLYGNFFNYISMDTPSSGAGNSYQHGYIDEGKYIEKKRVDKMFPALRGDATLFGHSPFFRGLTVTTDYPNLLMPGEHDWILSKEKEMNRDQMNALLYISLELNEKRADLLNAQRKRNHPLIKKLEKKVAELAVLHTRARFDSTFFYIASSFVNLDILTLDFFKTTLAALGEEEFNTSVLSLKPEVEAGQKFYVALDPDKHIYDDGIYEEWYNRYNTGDSAETYSTALRYCDSSRPLEIGVDFGDMCSIDVGQTKDNLVRGLKDFHTLAPQGPRELADQFLEFFKFHKLKRIELWGDRSGNANQATNRDWVSDLVRCLEYYPDGSETKWKVDVKTRGFGNISQQLEFLLVKAMMQGEIPGLPQIALDKYQMRHTISSMSVAKQVVKPNAKGIRQIHKDKSSEKLPLSKRPMNSTNLSDAFKYLVCRPQWIAILRNEKKDVWNPPDIIEE